MRRLITLLLMIGSFAAFAQFQNQKDDPQARWEFEFMRTKNPITHSIPDGIRIKEQLLMNQRQKELRTRDRLLATASPSTLAPAPITWKNRGPYNVGGRTRALAVDVSDPTENTILAGGVSGGLWRTTDGGATWSKMTSSTDLQSITCIAQDTRPGEESTWYYGTGEISGNTANSFFAPYRGDGIFKSTDGGLTWNALAATSSNIPERNDNAFNYNHEIVVNPTNGDVLVANQIGIYLSTDRGTSWERVLAFSQSSTAISWSDVAVSSTGILYAHLGIATQKETILSGGIYQSTTGGGLGSWTNIAAETNIPLSITDRYEIAIAPSDEDIVYVLGENTLDEDHALWKFDNATDNWTDLTANIPRLGGSTGDFDSQGGYDLLIKVKNDDPDFVVIGGINLFASTDGFSTPNTGPDGNANWIGGYDADNNSTASYANHHPDQQSFIFLDGNRAYSGTDGGVHLTSDITASTVSWTPLNNGYLTSQIYAASVGPGNQILIGLQDNGTWFADNTLTATDAWTMASGGDGGYSAINTDGTVRFLSSQFGSIGILTYSSADDPTANSSQEFTPVMDGYRSSLFTAPFYLDPENNDLLYLGGDRELWVNTEATSARNREGHNEGWKPIPVFMFDAVVSEIGIGSNEVVYVGSSFGNIVKVTDASTTTPAVEDVSGLDFLGSYVSGVSVSPDNNNHVLVTLSNYEVPSVFYTDDGGSTWTDVSGNLEEDPSGSGSGPSVRIGRILGNDFKYFVGTSTGLYSTDNLDGANTTWTRENESGIGSTVVEHIITREDGLVVAATHGNGVYSAVVPFLDTNMSVNSIDAPSTGVFNEDQTSILATLQNRGNLTVTNFTVSLFIDDQLVVLDNVSTLLNSLDIYQHTFSETYDFTTTGQYDIRVEVGISGDEDESSNTLSTTIASLLPLDIDMSVNSIDAPETGVFNENQTSILATLQNRGNLTVTDFTASLYIDDQLVVLDDVSTRLNNLDIYQHTFSKTYDFTTTGQYDIRVEVGISGDEDESSNTLSTTISSLLPLDIDMSVNSIDAPETGVFNENQTSILATLQNRGNLTVTDFTVSLFIDDQLVVLDDVSTRLNSLDIYQHTFSKTYDFTTTGEYGIRVEVGISGDEDESSNTLSTTIASLLPLDIDMSVNSIDAPETGVFNENQTSILATLQNRGNLTATSFTASLYIDDQLVVLDDVSTPLNSLDIYQHTFSKTYDFTTTGEYGIRVEVGISGDEDESSNTLSTTISSLLPLDIDMSVNSIDAPETGVFNENQTSILATLQNRGNLTATSFTASLYIDDQLVVLDDVSTLLNHLDIYQHTFSKTYDFTTAGQYGIRVEVGISGDEDESSNTLSTTIVSLKVPTDITLSNNMIAEQEAVGTLVGGLEAEDEDDDAHSFSLVSGQGSDDNESFSITTNAELKSGEVFDFDQQSVYTIRIEAEDNDGNTFAKSFEITISDVLAVPTDITLSNNMIAEQEAVGTVVGGLEAEDEDDDAHSFSLVSGQGSDDNGSFSITTDAELKSGEVFDFDQQSVYTIRIETEDNDGNTFAKSFAITISDVLAVDEWEKAGITVYPNPTKGRVALEMINDFIGDVSVRLASMDGKQVLLEKSYPKNQKSTRSLLDVSNLEAGVYYVTFQFGGTEITSKLIKE